ncbi:hypothetical protein SteCoe_32437 [Stentor coeruleus]|uniref:Uncharacterized protein n=1 Tax=Stentor coeruleus TaxID=5963 RepID=A0A1R2AZ24_9CILI|nr:hypothetical protein SteCoe_32437 [Stentor coeruleus]
MENSKSTLEELDKVLPEEWLNIPKPLIEAISSLKSCMKTQITEVCGLKSDYAEFELKMKKSILSAKTIAFDCSEMMSNVSLLMRDLESSTHKKLLNMRQDLENKISDSIQLQKIAIESKHMETKKQLDLIIRKLESLPTVNQVEELIVNMTTVSEAKTIEEFKEVFVIPEISMLERKVTSFNMDNQSRFENLDKKYENEVKQVFEKLTDANHKFKDFKHQTDLNFESDNERIQTLQSKLFALSNSSMKREKDFSDTLVKISEMQEKERDSHRSLGEWKRLHDEAMKSVKETLKIITEENSNIKLDVPKIPSVPSSPTLIIENESRVTIDELDNRLQTLKTEYDMQIEATRQGIIKDLTAYFDASSMEQKLSFDSYVKIIKELQDKISWLPVNAAVLENMNPMEARLFTVEARQRTEENARLESFDRLLSLIQSIIPSGITKPILEEFTPRLGVENDGSSYLSRSIEKKIESGLPPSEWWKPDDDYEHKKYSGSESVHGIRIKYSTPAPELNKSLDKFKKLKPKKRTPLLPKYVKLDLGKFPRIQTPSSQTTHLKYFKL